MTYDERLFKGLKIKSCVIPEPRGPIAAPAHDSIQVRVEDSEAHMSIEDFNSLLSANADLRAKNDVLTALLLERAKEAKWWRRAAIAWMIAAILAALR